VLVEGGVDALVFNAAEDGAIEVGVTRLRVTAGGWRVESALPLPDGRTAFLERLRSETRLVLQDPNTGGVTTIGLGQGRGRALSPLF